jgi:hypothetical protein
MYRTSCPVPLQEFANQARCYWTTNYFGYSEDAEEEMYSVTETFSVTETHSASDSSPCD